jgi:hypothetical protein
MKTSLIKLSSSFLVLLISCSVWAKPVAHVIELSGVAFVVTADGKTRPLKINDHIEDQSEVMVEENANLTLNDYYNATYHLIGGSHLKIFNKSVQLKKGKSWVQSMSARETLALTTANGHVDFSKGEFITTFDQSTSRSQFLVVNGEVEVSNVLDKDRKLAVGAGTFTVVDPEWENGLPRSPTKVGSASLNSAISEFKKLPEKIKEAILPARAVASTEVEASPHSKPGEIIFISTSRKPASVDPSLAKKYLKKMKPKSSKVRIVPVRVFGVEWTPKAVPVMPRRPASTTPESVPKVPSTTANNKGDMEFIESFKRHAEEQPKYSKELQNLIDDLKSY